MLWLRCVAHTEGQALLGECYANEAEAQEGARSLTEKIICLGVYLPNVYEDVAAIAKKCPECQTYTPFQNHASMTLTSISDP